MMPMAQTNVFGEITRERHMVVGVKVQIWARFDDRDGTWAAMCPNLEGINVSEAGYDQAVASCVHKLCTKVNRFKNAGQPVPWIDIGNRTPNKHDTIIIKKGVS